MGKVNAVITGVGGYVPDYVLTNDELSRMVDTSDEWIMTRVGIKERHILTEEGLGTSYMARKAANELLKKTGADPDSIDALIVCTTTPDYKFPSTASIVVGKLGLKNAFAFDMECAVNVGIINDHVVFEPVVAPIVAVILCAAAVLRRRDAAVRYPQRYGERESGLGFYAFLHV